MIVWDVRHLRDARRRRRSRGVEKGDLHLDLFGEKLRGRFALVRRGPTGEREQWLVVHKHDEHAVPGWEPLDHPASGAHRPHQRRGARGATERERHPG